MNLMDHPIVKAAERIAREAHKDQRRKWGSQAPYIVHPEKVARKVAMLPGMTAEDVAAAWLHDVLEDVAIPLGKVQEYSDLIEKECGITVLQLVTELTAPSEWPEFKDKSRVEKRAADWEYLARVSDQAKRIKLVDRWANCTDFEGAPPRMIQKYVPESRSLYNMCSYVDEAMADELALAICALEGRA